MTNEHCYYYRDADANGGGSCAAVAIVNKSGNHDDGRGGGDAIAIHHDRRQKKKQQQRQQKRIRQRAKLPVHVQVATSLLALYACCDSSTTTTEAFRGVQQQRQHQLQNGHVQHPNPLFATVENEQEQQVSTSSSSSPSSSNNPLHKTPAATESNHRDYTNHDNQKLFSKEVRELLLSEKKPYYAEKSTSQIKIIAPPKQQKNGVAIVTAKNGKKKNGIRVPPKLPLVNNQDSGNEATTKVPYSRTNSEASFTTVMDELDSLSDFDGTSTDPFFDDHQRNQMELLDLQAWEGSSSWAATATTATNATQTTTKSRIRRLGSFVRRTVGHYSPVRIFAEGHRYDDDDDQEKSTPITTTKEQQQQSLKGELFVTDEVDNNNNNKRKNKKVQKKQSKEEAMVARMSRKKKKQLSNLLKSVNKRNTKSMAGITSRSLTGLIAALAEEAEGLAVRMHAREDTPVWRKEIDMLTIEFTRLGFKPLSLGGPDQQLLPKAGKKKNKIKKAIQGVQGAAANFQPPDMEKLSQSLQSSVQKQRQQLSAVKPPPFLLQGKNKKVDDDDEDDSCPVEMADNPMADVSCADTAFQKIDVDNSGALDKDEIADALVLAASASSSAPYVAPSKKKTTKDNATDSNDSSLPAAAAAMGEKSRKVIQKLARQLVDLYDANDDGVIDRMEYQSMVEDMAALRQVQKEREEKERKAREEKDRQEGGGSWWSDVLGYVWRSSSDDDEVSNEDLDENIIDRISGKSAVVDISNATVGDDLIALTETAIRNDDGDDETPDTLGKIEFENLKIDLRQLVFGAVPVVKRVTPGGPLFLEPFKVTVTGSFTADDIMNSSLLDQGLRILVSFALRVRVRSFRDFADGAVFYGRKWKRSSAKSPLVECTELVSVEIDDQDRAIITGRAKIRASYDAPVIEQSFKLRTKVATPRNGRAIKLSEPEIALVLECPKQWEKNINATCAKLGIKPPPKPKPIFTYIPIHSPFKKDDDTGGYYMGEDNQLKSMYIKDKCLRFEMESILRPGKFLGSHYLAFTVPQRALIITVDRVKEGMRAARRRKKTLRALRKARAVETDRKAHHAEEAFLALDGLDGLHKDAVIKNPAAPFTGNQEQALEEEEDEQPKEAAGKGFISRFVDGYLQAGTEDENVVVLAHAISDWFGRQGISNSKPEAAGASSNSNSASDLESPRPGDAVTNLIEDVTFEQIRDDDDLTKRRQ